MRIELIVSSLFVLSCSTIRAEYDEHDMEAGLISSRDSEILSEVHRLTATYILKGDCQNWNAALAVAKAKMGCDGGRPPSAACQKALPCDVCRFLVEGAWPTADIVDFPAKKKGLENTIYGAVLWDSRWEGACPVDDKTRAEFKRALCFGDGVWGLDKVDTLAKAMVHEALHLCRVVGKRGAAITDKRFWDYLFCAGDDAADVVDICWDSRDS